MPWIFRALDEFKRERERKTAAAVLALALASAALLKVKGLAEGEPR